MGRIGLLAGAGKLPEIWLGEALKAGEEVVAYHINPPVNDHVEPRETGDSGGKSDITDESKADNRPDLSRALWVREIGAGRLGELIELLKDDNIKKIIMLGKLKKSRVFQPAELDREMQQLLAGLGDLQDETILQAIARRLGQEGFELLPQNSHLDNIFLEEGWLVEPFSSGAAEPEDPAAVSFEEASRIVAESTSEEESRIEAESEDLDAVSSEEASEETPRIEAESEDPTAVPSEEASRVVSERAAEHSSSEKLKQKLEWGLELAKQLSGMEIGQSIMFKSGTVLAVEAVEGTDAAICRAGELAGTDGSGFFMAKASRPGQDFRLDIPAVGPETLSCLKDAGGRALAVEAGRVLVLEQEKITEMAAEWGIAIYAGRIE